MRALHKAWQDKRPGWTKRVRWYEDSKSVRLQVDERVILNDVSHGSVESNRQKYQATFTDKVQAQYWFDRYTADMPGRAWWFAIKETQEAETS